MKGLLINNFYAVESNLKIIVSISFIAMVIIAITPLSPNVYIVIPGELGLFSGLAGVAIQKDANCKWNKFELTMPVSKKTVINARYISFFTHLLLGFFLALLTAFIFYIVTGSINLERLGYSLAFGLGFSLTIPAFIYPMILILGSDKGESVMIISMILSFAVFFASSTLVTMFSKNFDNANLIFRISYLALSAGIYILSYMFSLFYYRKKEL